MICKRGLSPCPMIGCDCYRTAPIEAVDQELRYAGIDPEELAKLTKTTLKLIHRNIDLEAALAAERAKVRELVEALAWYVREDDVYEDMEGNEFWVEGKRKAQALIEKYKEGA